jgi:uncharacterized protein involved in oxidation of intracellular sulfur
LIHVKPAVRAVRHTSRTGMSGTLVIVNDAPYGSERSYNALRLAGALAKTEELRLFLFGDAAACAKSGQKVPAGFYNVELMLDRLARAGARIGVCGTCMAARGIGEPELAAGCHPSNLDELAEWTRWAGRTLVF